LEEAMCEGFARLNLRGFENLGGLRPEIENENITGTNSSSSSFITLDIKY